MPAAPLLRQYLHICTSTHFTPHFAHFKMHACDADVDLRQYLYFCTSTHFTAHFKLHACDADVDGLLVRSAAPRFGVLAFGRHALRQHARAEAALHRLERRGRHLRGSFASVFVLLYQHSLYYSFRLRARKQRCTDLSIEADTSKAVLRRYLCFCISSASSKMSNMSTFGLEPFEQPLEKLCGIVLKLDRLVHTCSICQRTSAHVSVYFCTFVLALIFLLILASF